MSIFLHTLVELEGTEGTSATSMDDTFRDTFMIETLDLLAGSVIFQEHWPSLVLGGDLEPVICGSG